MTNINKIYTFTDFYTISIFINTKLDIYFLRRGTTTSDNMETKSNILIVFMGMLLVSCIFNMEIAYARERYISYDPITQDPHNMCKRGHGKIYNCQKLPPPSNPYRRGCEKGNRCRGGSPGLTTTTPDEVILHA